MIAGVVDAGPAEGKLARVGQARPRDHSPASRGGGIVNDKTNTGATAQTAPVPSEAEVEARVEALLGRMSLEEKIGQLTQIGGAAFLPGFPEGTLQLRTGIGGS